MNRWLQRWAVMVGVACGGATAAQPSGTPAALAGGSSPPPAVSPPTGGPTAPEKVLVIRTSGQPDRQVRVLNVSTFSDGESIADVQDLATGQRFSIPGPMLAYLQKQTGSAPATAPHTREVATAAGTPSRAVPPTPQPQPAPTPLPQPPPHAPSASTVTRPAEPIVSPTPVRKPDVWRSTGETAVATPPPNAPTPQPVQPTAQTVRPAPAVAPTPVPGPRRDVWSPIRPAAGTGTVPPTAPAAPTATPNTLPSATTPGFQPVPSPATGSGGSGMSGSVVRGQTAP